MSCRDELTKEENGTIEDRLLCEMRLARIADVWDYRRTIKYHKWVAGCNRRVDELNKEADQQQKFDEKYFIPWIKELETLHDELVDLLDKWKAGEDVTPADWNAVTAGRERKEVHIVFHGLPKDAWPLPVRDQFPNLIALLNYDWEVRLREWRQQQYAKTIEDIVGNCFHTEVFDHRKRYEDVVKHFAEQGTINLELKRLADDMSDSVGWRTPMTAEQIGQLGVQLKTDQAHSYPDVDGMLLDHLRYEDVMSQDFDAHAWVRKIFHEQNLSATSKARHRAAQMVHAWVEYWQTPLGVKADVLSANDVKPEPFQAHGCNIPYDCMYLNDGHEPNSSVDIIETSEIGYEDELCLPVEPVRDQFGMDLNDDTEHTDEYFPPFDV